LMNCVPLYPVAGTPFGELPTPSPSLLTAVRSAAGLQVPQMFHCTRCRADALGLLDEKPTAAQFAVQEATAVAPLRPDENRPYVAVASYEGMLINQHLGEAEHLQIYGKDAEGRVTLIDTRATPEKGQGAMRWQALADVLGDCRVLLASQAGDTPKRALDAAGIRLILAEGLIEETVNAVLNGQRVPRPVQRRACNAGGCVGSGTGCG
jgi:nitrogen fixation protein NifB